MFRRLSFLPTFFTLLAIALAAGIVVRVRSRAPASLSTVAERGPGASATPAAEPAAAVAAPLAAPPQTPAAAQEQERERRYRELLQAPPPVPLPAASGASAAAAPHPAATEAKPSLLSRLLSPVVSAVTGGSKREAGTRGANSIVQTQAAGQTGGKSQEKPGPSENTDPDSDTSPPRLQAVDFTPSSVQDGAETVMTVVATDDQSGVRYVSGNIASPAGALQGFSAQKDGDTGRFVARIVVPKGGAEGMWHVNFLSLTDGAGNVATLAWRQGALPQSAQFHVTSSKSDSTPPAIRAVWPDRTSMHTGERNALNVDVTDDSSGVKGATGVFVSPSKIARFVFTCQAGEGTIWRCDLTPPTGADCGDWQLEQLQVLDNANNIAVLQTDSPIVAKVRVAISSDHCDSHPPVVQSVSIDNPVVSAPSIVNLTILATDDSSGVSNVSGAFTFTGPVPGGTPQPRLYFTCRATGSDNQTWVGGVAIPERAARGVWRLTAINVADRAGNFFVYTQTDAVAANVTFRVQ